jgi:hypothetical protein
VFKLLSTVKRVISKLKIELHQDYLSLGQINVGIQATPTSSQTGSKTTLPAHDPAAFISPILSHRPTETTLRAGASTNRSVMTKVLEEMAGLTFEGKGTNQKS